MEEDACGLQMSQVTGADKGHSVRGDWGPLWIEPRPAMAAVGLGEQRRGLHGYVQGWWAHLRIDPAQSDSIPSENGFFNASISCFENAN